MADSSYGAGNSSLFPEAGSSRNESSGHISADDFDLNNPALFNFDDLGFIDEGSAMLEGYNAQAQYSSPQSQDNPDVSSSDDTKGKGKDKGKGKGKELEVRNFRLLAPRPAGVTAARDSSSNKVAPKQTGRNRRRRYEKEKRKIVGSKRLEGICYHCRSRRATVRPPVQVYRQ